MNFLPKIFKSKLSDRRYELAQSKFSSKLANKVNIA